LHGDGDESLFHYCCSNLQSVENTGSVGRLTGRVTALVVNRCHRGVVGTDHNQREFLAKALRR
jgi:hypothetical protein